MSTRNGLLTIGEEVLGELGKVANQHDVIDIKAALTRQLFAVLGPGKTEDAITLKTGQRFGG